jgi:YVTN family beta-propeller protein
VRPNGSEVEDGLGQTVTTGCLVGAGLGGTTLFVMLLGALAGLSFGSCNFDLKATPNAPVRDGLGIAVSGDGNQVVTVDSSSGLLDVISGGRLRDQVVVGGQTTGVALSPDGRTALVTDSEVGNASGVLAVVDTATASVTARITVGSGPSGVVFSPDARLAYVADTGYVGAGNIDVVDLRRGIVTDSVPVGKQPAGLTLNGDGSRLYVIDATLYLPLPLPPTPTLPGDVDIIDTRSLKVIATVPVGVAPLFASMSPSGQTLAVGDYGSNAVTLLDTTTLAVHTVSVTNGVFGLAYSTDGTRLFVCGGNSPLVDSAPGAERLNHVRTDVVSVLDAVAGGVVATVNVAHDPTAVATGPDGAAYVALGTFPAVARIDPTTLRVSQIGVPALAPASANGASR